MKDLKAFLVKLKSKWANRKRLAPSVRCLLEIVAILAVYLAIALPIHYQFAVFSWHWFAFGLMALLFPCSFIYGKVYVEDRQTFTKEQSQRANLLLAGRILFYWLADCAYMAIFNQWTVWIFILCGITLSVIFWNLVRAFLGQTQKGGIFGFSLFLDFLVGVGLTIYLLSLISDPNLQQIIASVVAAIFGGVFTLVGVAWTIRKGDEDRKKDLERIHFEQTEQERKHLIPYLNLANQPSVAYIQTVRSSKLKGINHTDPKYAKNGRIVYSLALINDFYVKNISNSNIILVGVKVADEYCEFDNQVIIAKDECCKISVTGNTMLPLRNLLLAMEVIAQDIMGNKYFIKCLLEENESRRFSTSEQMGDVELVGIPITYKIFSITLPTLFEEANNE